MQVDFDGTIHEFPDDFTDEDIAYALGQSAPSSVATNPFMGSVGAAETVGSLLTGAVGEVAGGLEGLARLPFQGVAKATEEMQKTQEALTYQPRTQIGQRMTEGIGNVFSNIIEKGAQGAEYIAPAEYENEARLAGTVGTQAFLEFLPLGAATKGVKALGRRVNKPSVPSEAVANLDRIAEAKKAGTAPEVDTTAYKQQDLAIEPPDVDASGIRNPYDVGGQISDTAAGLDTMLDSPQGDLFAQGIRESVQNRPDIVAAKEAFQNEALDIEARMRAAFFIIDNHKMYDRKTVRAAKDTVIDLQKAHQGNRDAYAIGNELLAADKPRDALGRPLYEQPEPLVQPGGEVGGKPVDVKGPDLSNVPTEGVIGNDPVLFRSVETPKRVPKKQKGAINPSIVKDTFVSEKDLGSGYTAHAFTTRDFVSPSSPYPELRIEVRKNGQAVGSVAFEVDKPFGPASEASLMSAFMPFVDPELRGQGLGKAMYQYASELGNDIKQTKTLTPHGHMLWDSMEKVGMAREGKGGWREIPSRRGVSDEFLSAHRKQLGAWTPWAKGEIKKLKDPVGTKSHEMVTEVERTAKLLSDEVDARENLFKDIGAGEVDMIAPDAPVTPELMDKILFEPDVGSGKNLVSGALSKAELNNSTGARTVYRWFSNGIKRAERFDRDYVRPVAAAARSFFAKPEEMKALKHIFEKELEMGARFTDEELMSAGLNEKVLNTYAGMRRMFDAALERQNAARADAGLSKISDLEAYQASRWNGPWRATVLDADGNIVWQVAEKNKLAAMQAVDWLKKNVDEGLQIGKIKYNETYGRNSPDLQAGYVEMVNLLGTDHPITARIKELLESQAAFTTENLMGQEKHFKRKEGVRGFAGDRPWAKNDPKDWFLEQLTYAKNAATWAEQQTAVRNTKELLANPDLVANKENLAAYAKQYMDHQRGIGTKKVFDEVEHAIAKTLGVSPAHLDTLLGTSKSIFYITKLGMMNIPFTAAQLIQPIFTAPYHSVLAKEGFGHNPAKSSIEGLSNSYNFTKVHLLRFGGMDDLADATLHKMHPLFRDAALYAEQNGLIDVSQFSDIRDLNRPRAIQVAEQVAGFNIKASEQLARSTAFFSFVSHLDQSGKFPNTKEGRMALYQRAEEATRFTMVDYTPAERALLFSKMGLTGQALSTLQTFKLNWANQAIKYIDELRNGNPLPALQFFGLYYLLGGLTGFVGVEDADALYEGFKSILSDEQFAALPKAMREFGVKKSIMEMDEAVSMGPVSKLTGVNLYTRFDSSNMIPLEGDIAETLGNLFPFAKDLYAQAGGAKDLMSGDPSKRLAGGMALMPSSLKGPYENMAPGFTTPEGVVGRSTNPAEGDYRRTEEERNLRNYGFRSTKEAKTRELDFRDKKTQTDLQSRRSNIARKVSNQILFGKVEDLNDSIEAYTRLGGDPEDLVTDAGLEQKFFNKNTTRLEKLQKAAESGKLPALYDLLRYMESQGVQQNN